MTLLAKSANVCGVAESLLQHSIRVTDMIDHLFARLPPSRDFDAALLVDLKFAASCHDMGKAAVGFQAMLAGRQPNWMGRRHEVLSASFAAALGVTEEVVFAILTHHKRIPDFPQIDHGGRLRFRGFLPEDWTEMLRQFYENRAAVADLWKELSSHSDLPVIPQIDELAMSGEFISPAWLRTDRQRKSVPAAVRRRASLIRGLLISADHLASGQTTPPVPLNLKKFSPKFDLRPFQRASAMDGNLILRAPTGSGKTEAALAWAARNQTSNGRFFYTLPYTAALNAMYERLRKEFPRQADSVGLLHGRAAHHLFDAIQEDYPGEPAQASSEAQARARLAREMYHSARVCTPHQLLRYTLRGKGWEQILSEIPGACVVFDEVHSYDAALAGLTLGTARLFHKLGAKLMFISATLPAFFERIISQIVPCDRIEPDRNLAGDRDIAQRRRHIVRVEDDSLLSLLPEIVSAANSGARVLVVCNHVRSAQLMADEIRKILSDGRVCLFHSRFNMRDRREIERRLSFATLPSVLVATQVVEVSLDISFDCGYFEAAPIDALAQRMGRVNRRGEKPPVRITVASRALNSHVLYDSSRTQCTLALLRGLDGPVSEQDLTDICDKVYAGGYDEEELRSFNERLNHPYLIDFEQKMIAGDHEDWTEELINLAGRVDVLPRSLRPEYAALIRERRWLEADALTINIRPSSGLQARLDKTHEPWIINLPYDRNGLEVK